MNNVVIFFDLFDTLTTANRGYLEPYFDAEIDKLGDIGILKNARMTIEEIVKKNPCLLEKYKLEEMVKYYEDCMNKSIMNIDSDIYNMLKELKENGYKLCVISDASYTDIEKWRSSPLSLFFDETIFSCELGYAKPDVKIYDKAKEIMGNSIKNIFIGDGGHDELYGAILSGMQTIKANWFTNRIEKNILQYSNYETDDVKKVHEIIKKI